jgi:putative ABC transport system substrate-binding protein
MRRRELITPIVGATVMWPFAACAQQPAGRIPRLCFLTFDPGWASRFPGFFQGLRELGYVDGQTITIDYLSAVFRMISGETAATLVRTRLLEPA